MATRKTRKANPAINAFDMAEHERFINGHFVTAWSNTDETRSDACRQTSIRFRPKGAPFQVEFHEERRVMAYFDGNHYRFIRRTVKCIVDGHWTDTVECWAEFGDLMDDRVSTKAGSGGRLTTDKAGKHLNCVAVENDEDALDNLSAAITFITQVARGFRAEIEGSKS